MQTSKILVVVTSKIVVTSKVLKTGFMTFNTFEERKSSQKLSLSLTFTLCYGFAVNEDWIVFKTKWGFFAKGIQRLCLFVAQACFSPSLRLSKIVKP